MEYNKKRLFKSLTTLYCDFKDCCVDREIPDLASRELRNNIDYSFARKGSIFELEEINEESYKYELTNKKLSVYFETIEQVEKCEWFKEITK